MPPLPEVPNVVRVDWLWTVGDDTDVSTRNYFKYAGSAPNSATCVTLAADIYALQALTPNDWGTDVTLRGTKVTDLSNNAGGVGEHAQSAVGTRVGDMLPAGTAVLVNYVIARRYRGGKPRSYFPFFTSPDLVSAQTWDGTALSSTDSHLAAYFAGVQGISVSGTTLGQHVNVSYYSGFTAVENPITHRWRNVPNVRSVPLVDDILSFAASARVASQRRRL